MKQLSVFFGLAFLISWIIWLPLWGVYFGMNLPVLPYHHGLGGLGPIIASFLTTWIFPGKESVKSLAAKCIQITPLPYFTAALFSPFILVLGASVIGYYADGTELNLSGLLKSKEFPEFSLPLFFIYNLIFFGLGEEAGWRGFALPRFQEKMSPLRAGILLTLFWALWHLPLFLYRPGYLSMGVAGAVGWVLSLLTGSILLTWFYNSSKGSILICAVFHTAMDVVFTAEAAGKNIINYTGFLITVWGILTVFILLLENRNGVK
ncbi:MAG TPA: type II CAAX endopeptidase family protein [Leptospiraceae bacterium]|nr:type II CAAX endopeptidase family protein [Leptospiraceae bacterium]HNF13593.1 type II CAAX endopeptidase family protein [Leptospiraceae bacterium]HNF27347.1 type II CAAX endopeptidase family protein [Leptospiraceae bacterium]HNH08753.1 type II CAAX endopeptidase family protein [Leptospiraceae bacterium]HNM06279.1 type II CAAX endopeptidase family protein [Leptospiraceae bacterium]